MCERSAQDAAALLRLCKGEDVEELDVQAAVRASCEFGDPVALVEPEHELLAGVLGRVELVEPKGDARLRGEKPEP